MELHFVSGDMEKKQFEQRDRCGSGMWVLLRKEQRAWNVSAFNVCGILKSGKCLLSVRPGVHARHRSWCMLPELEKQRIMGNHEMASPNSSLEPCLMISYFKTCLELYKSHSARRWFRGGGVPALCISGYASGF